MMDYNVDILMDFLEIDLQSFFFTGYILHADYVY
jgi:hypothetical protein